MPRYDVTITINYPNATETELSAVGQTKFAEIGEMVEFALLANGVKESDWSSLVLTIVAPDVVPVPAKPKLRVV